MTNDPLRWWHREEKFLVCDLCPHQCHLEKGQIGLCGVRRHFPEGHLSLEGYGKISSIAEDPVEKKPLFHWHPGTTILSIGSVGCNMSCPYCQNWPIAHSFRSIEVTEKTPEDILKIADANVSKSVAFTYNEPIVNYEFIHRTSKLLQSHEIESVLVTNGQIMPKPLNELISQISAVNIDLKGFSQKTYDKLRGRLNTTLDSILKISESDIHMEITALIVPGISDNQDEFEKMTDWIAKNIPNVPLHLSRYFPAWHWKKEPTGIDLMNRFYEIAFEKLSWVYEGNMNTDNSTYCPECGYELVRRSIYCSEVTGLNQLSECSRCKKKTGIVL